MAVTTQDLAYADGGLRCLGYLARDEARSGPRPGVLVIPEAWGLSEHAMERTRRLAAMGYVAFAADMLGDRRQLRLGELRPVVGALLADHKTLRQRAAAALDTLAAQPGVDVARLFAIGFCFGGTTAFELARDGRDLLGVVGFHSRLTTTAPAAPGSIKARVLALIGADDPLVPAADRAAFENEMRAAGADWQLVLYGNTLHSFTDPAAQERKLPGAAYQAQSDRRAWQAMQDFFEEQLA